MFWAPRILATDSGYWARLGLGEGGRAVRTHLLTYIISRLPSFPRKKTPYVHLTVVCSCDEFRL